MIDTRVFKRSLVALGVLLLAACASTPQPPLAAQTYFRGLVRAVDNQLQFRACDQTNWAELRLASDDLRERLVDRLISLPFGVGIYLEAWGDSQTPIAELQMLGGDIATCRYELNGIQLRAGGLNPVWYADIKDGELQVHDSTRLRSWRLTQPQFRQRGDRWSWSGESVSLTIRTEPCRDALDVDYALSAEFVAAGTRLQGCARYGDLQRNLLKTRYYSRDSGLMRQFGLQLQANGRFSLSLIDRQGEADRYNGRWQMLNSGQLLLRLQDERLRGSGRSLRLQPSAGELRLVSDHPVFGSGTRLYPGTEPLLSTLRLSRAIP